MSGPRAAPPNEGSVLGIDIGFSPVRRSSAVCRLEWTCETLTWTIDRFRYEPEERRRVIAATASARPLLAVAIDGPLGPDLVPVTRYRMAERMLTSGFGPLIGKPGASSAPIGRRLAVAACEAAQTTLEVAAIAPARHEARFHERAIVEAFPSTFLGVLLGDPARVPARRTDRSDVFYAALVADGALARLVERCCPGRQIDDFAAVHHHDDRAALVCAVTALLVAAGDVTLVGDEEGRIALPPLDAMAPWARDLLAVNSAKYGGEVRDL